MNISSKGPKAISVFFASLLHVMLNLSLSSQSFTNFNTANSTLPDNYTWCVSKGPDGKIYVGTDYGLAVFNNQEITVYNSQNSGLSSNSVRNIFHDEDGSLWIGTFTGGLFHFDGQNWTNFNTQNSNLPDDFIRAMVKDNNGIYWLGTGNGLVRFDGASATDVWDEFNSGLESRNISALALGSGNVKIIGTINGGLAYYNDTTFTVFVSSNSALPDNTITDFDFTESNLPIFAMPDGGVAIHQGENNFTWYNPIVVSAMPTKAIECISYLGNGSFWAGSTDKGLIKRNEDGSWQSYQTSNSEISANWVRDLVVDDFGKVWMAMALNGVELFDPTPNGIETIIESPLKVFLSDANTLNFHSEKPINHVEMFDLSGRKIHAESIGKNQNQIRFYANSKGLILLHITYADGTKQATRISGIY